MRPLSAMPLTLQNKVGECSGVGCGDRSFWLDKTKGMVYVLMSENTQSVGFVWPIWQSSSAGIFRLTASAPELACSGYRLTGSCGLVDDVAAAGRPREFGNGGAAGGARGVGGSGAAGETGGREARVEPYRRAESRSHALAAGGGGSGVRPGFRDVNPVGAGRTCCRGCFWWMAPRCACRTRQP